MTSERERNSRSFVVLVPAFDWLLEFQWHLLSLFIIREAKCCFFQNRLNLVNLISVWWLRSVRTQNLLNFQKWSILSKVMLLEFRRRSCLQKAFFEKPTTPSFRAYFITLICVLVPWNYQLINGIINDNWNVGKFMHSFSPSKGETRLP